MVNGSNGLSECKEIIENAGGRIDSGWISGIDLATASADLRDAVQFLIEEWDYACGGKRHAAAMTLPNKPKPLHCPAPDLRGRERDKKGKLLDSVEVTYPVSYCYNGGTSIDGKLYTGYEVPPPILPNGYELVNLGAGLQFNARPPYATMLLKKSVASRGAVLSEDRLYRYHLWRTENNRHREHVLFIGLNPSTADETEDDMTIAKCQKFTKLWGFKGFHMLNLYAFRATLPEDLVRAESPVQEPGPIPRTDNLLAYYSQRCGKVVVCWGTVAAKHRKALKWDERLTTVLGLIDRPIYCLGKTADGSPRHPSRLAYATPLELFLEKIDDAY